MHFMKVLNRKFYSISSQPHVYQYTLPRVELQTEDDLLSHESNLISEGDRYRSGHMCYSIR